MRLSINKENAINKIDAFTRSRCFNYGFVAGFLSCVFLIIILWKFKLKDNE